MADVFVSYSQKDRERAEQVADALRSCGWSVWSSAFEDAEVVSAKCLLMLWSKASVGVWRLLTFAAPFPREQLFVQAILEDVDIPHQFRHFHYADLTDWTGDSGAKEFRDLRRLIEMHMQRTPSAGQPISIQRIEDGYGPQTPAEPATARRVFLCYRRQDTQGHTGRLRDRLVSVYGKDAVFMDVDDVPHGIDFVEYIEGVLTGCAVMVVMIGQSWATIADRKGRRRLDQPNDLLRCEIAAALRGKIPVIPVLVEDASMPDAEDVPEDIRGLTRRTAIELTHRRWEADVQQVLKVIEKFMGAGNAEI